MASIVKDCKKIKTILTPDATIVVHHFPVDDATKDSTEESNSITNPETVQNLEEQVPPLIKTAGLRCRTCLDVITTQRCYFLMIMGHLTKTIKEMIIFCIPQMASTLSDDDVICYKCLHAIEFCVKFIESCLEVEAKIQKSKEVVNNGEHFEENDSPITCEDVIINDHDYVVETEPDERENSQNLGTQLSSPNNLQPSKSNSDEIGTDTQPSQETLKGPNSVLKSQTIREISQLQEIFETVTRDCFKCGYCSKSCRTENCLLDHMRRMHKTIQKPTEEDKVVSPTLDRSPSSSNGKRISINKSNCKKRSHKKHEQNEKHEDDPLIKCPFCVQKLRLSQMEAHLRQHNQGQTDSAPSKKRIIMKKRMLKCKICLERFFSKEEYKDHLKIHPPYICEQCGKGFIQYSSLVSHKTTHNDPNTFICEFCGKGYKERNVLNVHRKLHENKTFDCDKCSKVFKTKLRLKMHVQLVHNSFGVGQCSQCDRIFKSRSSLKSHVRLVHLKLKPFKCEICEKEFGRADYLRLHVKIHNKEPSAAGKRQIKPGRKMRWKIMFPDSSTSSELLPCKFCGKRFQGVPKLKMHLETHVRRYACQYCPLTFARPQYRTRHELLHNGTENFYRCNICWKRMESEEELEEHVELKHNNLKYTCHVCGQMFHNTFLLNQHSLREHNSAPENIENTKQIIFQSLLEATGNNET